MATNPNQFRDKARRDIYTAQLASIISEAMASDPAMRDEAIVEGRIGLNEMSDTDLISFGVDCWSHHPQTEQ